MKRFIKAGILALLAVCHTAQAQTGMDQTAMQIVAEMAPGWNLGNTMEASNWRTQTALWNNQGGLGAETSWQSTKTTQEIIDYVKSLGFKSVRIPCAWALGHISDADNYTIDAAWMARVKEIVDYCINDGLYVVLNDHWDGGWLEEHIADTDPNTIAKNKAILGKLWTQIAEAFKDYDEHLLFAGLNEPNASTQAATNNLLAYEQVFVDAVRATGGNNQKRVLVVQGPSTNIDHTCNFMKTMPTDETSGKLAVEVHYYDPWQFWGMEKDESWGKVFYYWGAVNHVSGSQHNATWGEESYMKQQLQKMKTNFIDKGYPVVIGEFGANWRNISTLSGENQDKHNASIKLHYRELHHLCKEFGGFVPMVWDINDPNQHGTTGTMTIVNRSNRTVFNTYALEGINEIYPQPDITGISQEPVSIGRINGAAAKYNIAGQRVDDSYKGIVIQNGKKYVAK
ncbi:MAG: glycoside hydrolase family 5 protein [Prevotella sp.]|nr:glycoside hydrolase family 5 protein [Prevotella sp.]